MSWSNQIFTCPFQIDQLQSLEATISSPSLFCIGYCSFLILSKCKVVNFHYCSSDKYVTSEIVNMHSEIEGLHYFSNVYQLFQIVKFHYLKKFIYITEIVNAHYFRVHIHYFGSDLLITTTVVKFHYFTFREILSYNLLYILFTLFYTFLTVLKLSIYFLYIITLFYIY